MRLGRWLGLIAVMGAIGMLKVSQQTAIWQKAYALGSQAKALHILENDTQRLATQVVALQSPAHLGAALQRRKERLVAWTSLADSPAHVQLAQRIEQSGSGSRTNASGNVVR